jgi:hypothetical protein
MIVKGEFESLSMAIYGELVSDIPPAADTYEPQPLPTVNPSSLSKAVDPANTIDPTLLAKQLLSLIPDSPPLSLVIRLMFCMKPTNEDWDAPDFPYLHADLDTEIEGFDLDGALDITTKPIAEETSEETLTRFAESIGNCLANKVRFFVRIPLLFVNSKVF